MIFKVAGLTGSYWAAIGVFPGAAPVRAGVDIEIIVFAELWTCQRSSIYIGPIRTLLFYVAIILKIMKKAEQNCKKYKIAEMFCEHEISGNCY